MASDWLDIRIKLSSGDMEVLLKYAKGAKRYLEIGTANGGSALLAKTAAEEVYTIDIDQNSFKFQGIDTGINFIVGDSLKIAETWDKPIDVLFIDGNHNNAYKDFQAWERFVVKGGYILFHDYLNYGNKMTVRKDLEPLMSDDRYEKIFIPDYPHSKTRILQTRKL